MDQQNTTTATETAAEKKAGLARLWAFLIAMYEALRAFVRAMLGLGAEAVGELKGDAVAVARGARRGVEATGRVVGLGLGGPARVLDATASAVGSTLGALLPREPVTAAAVARGAVARDDRRETTAGYAPVEAVEVPSPAPPLTTPLLVKAHADAALDGTGHRTRGLPPIDAELATWIRTLPKGQLLKVAVATPEAIARHLSAPNNDQRIPGVLPVPTPAALRAAKTRVDAAMAILKSLPTRPDLSAADAFRALGVNDDQPEDEPVARFGR
ncbi:hypothetical protein FV226_08085 [Methylobacterium sp. WL12]|uniref:hypothetical protein n=1 Tax=Methylobacterium sp. WL12 TaxID=2603890 RepID=UPI0011C9CAE0|nr:hypothetical protein [Methylobacterium sp. WL12]TXM73764.1 hypothetical protein FV226_08085 [Methylobacterium sp. WL12]